MGLVDFQETLSVELVDLEQVQEVVKYFLESLLLGWFFFEHFLWFVCVDKDLLEWDKLSSEDL